MEITEQYLELLDYKLEDRLSGVGKDLVLESFDATENMLAFFLSNKIKELPDEVIKTVTVIETPPWIKNYGRQFLLQTKEERQLLQQSQPDLVIREATQEELVQLKALQGDEEC